jgi:tRNA nucleotidyltransferase (CCA-adding enzyme)
MGMDSNDIDIAIDTMSGEPFALAVKDYMERNGYHMSQVSKIQMNPEKSKHLETATARLLDQEIDFVNLRSETYHEHSRNPEVEFGSPLEDALRRDLTINSLFYNLHTNQVEDFTGHGLEDMKNQYARTPLPPFQTLLDDPLRLLRIIRFATRFGYSLDPTIMEAAKNPVIHQAFIKKLSRERVGTEMEKMMKGNDPARSIQLICDFDCYRLVLEPPAGCTAEPIAHEDAVNVSSTVARLYESPALKEIPWISDIDSIDSKQHIFLAAACIPYRNSTYKLKSKTVSSIKYIVGQSLKLSTHQSEFCAGLLVNLDKICETVFRDINTPSDRKTLGLFIRDIASRPLGRHWDLCVLMAMVFELSQLGKSNFADSDASGIINRYTHFMNRVIKYNLRDVHELKPVLDGKRIANVLGIKPGPQMGHLIQQLMEWQVGMGNVSEEEAIHWVKRHFTDLQKIE